QAQWPTTSQNAALRHGIPSRRRIFSKRAAVSLLCGQESGVSQRACPQNEWDFLVIGCFVGFNFCRTEHHLTATPALSTNRRRSNRMRRRDILLFLTGAVIWP